VNPPSPDCPAPVNWRLGLLLFLAVLALSIPQAALLPLLDRDEPRFAEASREMLQSGDYIVPTFNGAPRYAKPPLIYWCQTVAYRLLGENAFAARLPSLLATAATALLLATWAMKLGSAQMGAAAGLLYAFCLQTVQQGRVATADALLIFFMTLTAFTGWKILHPKEPGRVPAICFIVLAFGFAGGFLAKGPEALLPFLPLLWCARNSGRAAVIGIVLSFLAGLALVLLWAIPAYIETNGDYWRVGLSEGVGQRMVSGLQGHGA
jgi:4-amino-4-deoxy-L-arabinose transferase-like glycosyltransferase